MSRRLRIAFLASRFPYPPHRGDRLTAYHLLRTLSTAHDVTLFSFTDGREPPGGRERLAAMGVRLETVRLSRARSWAQAWAGLLSRVPSQVAYYRSREMRARVGDALESGPYDAVFTQLFRMAPYAAALRHPVKILFLADSLGLALERAIPYSPLWRRPGMRWEARRVARYEVEAASAFREAWVLSPVDARALASRGCRNVHVLPHGVDETLFGLERVASDRPTVVFLGNLSVPHNVDAARHAALDVWPAVQAAEPRARLRLVGADPVAAVRRLGQIPGVEVTGPVPDLGVVWRAADALLAPLRYSTGIQNKLLEAMAAGVPVVTTPQAAEAILAHHGEHLLAVETARDLASAVLDVLRQPVAAERRSARARAHVREHFTWEASRRRIEELVAAGGPAG